MTDDELVEEFMFRTGVTDRRRAARAVDATLEMLGERLGRTGAGAVAAALPPGAAASLGRARGGQAPDLVELYEHVAARTGAPIGAAVEQARAACAVLAGLLSPDPLRLLRNRLPPDWTPLLAEPQPAGAARPAPHLRPGAGHTLASGRPGSRHPISEAAPPDAHAESVARADDPHADTKLSSEREPRAEQTLSAGAPGSSAPLADAGPERRQ